MRDSFNFFKSFYEAIDQLGDKSQLKLYKAIMKLNFNCCENVTELEQLCSEIETELKQNRSVFAQFLLMKPILLKSAKGYINGLAGGAPKGNLNAKKTTYKDKDKEEDKDKEKDKKEINKEKVFCSENQEPIKKKTDPFTNPLIDKCFDIYKQECPDLLKLGFEPRNREIREELQDFLNEIDADIGYFTQLCQKANSLKQIVNKTIDFKMLIKNHIGIFNGKYKDNSTFDYNEWLKAQKQNESG